MPSTLREKRESGLRKAMREMVTPFLLGFLTTRRAVGVPTPVKTVSKATVSVEKMSLSAGESVKSSLMQEVAIKPKRATNVNKSERIFFMIGKRSGAMIYCPDHYRHFLQVNEIHAHSRRGIRRPPCLASDQLVEEC